MHGWHIFGGHVTDSYLYVKVLGNVTNFLQMRVVVTHYKLCLDKDR